MLRARSTVRRGWGRIEAQAPREVDSATWEQAEGHAPREVDGAAFGSGCALHVESTAGRADT